MILSERDHVRNIKDRFDRNWKVRISFRQTGAYRLMEQASLMVQTSVTSVVPSLSVEILMPKCPNAVPMEKSDYREY